MPITPSKASSARKRRWNAPPPLTRGTETIEGEEILDEVDGPAGVLLWQAIRNVSLWTATEGQARGALFVGSAAEQRRKAVKKAKPDSAVREPLEALSQLLESPGGIRPREVAVASTRIAEWALERELPATAQIYMQAAALATPRSAELAFRVGLISRSRRQFARAESWFRQAITLGRQTGAWPAYTLAYVELSELQVQRGSVGEARRSLIKAMRAARRKGLTGEEARALHALQRVSALVGRYDDAESYARLVFDVYGDDHPDVARLTRDVAFGRILAGSYGTAIPLLRALEPLAGNPGERLLIDGHLARASAGLRKVGEFEAAAKRVHEAVNASPDLPDAPGALLDVAHGASLLGKWSVARKTADRAAELAQARLELRISQEATALAEAAREKKTLNVHHDSRDQEKPFEDRLLETLGASEKLATPTR